MGSSLDSVFGNPDPHIAPPLEVVAAEMGEVRRRYWLGAALYFLGDGATIEHAKDVLQNFIATNLANVCRKYRPTRGVFHVYLRDAFRYFCWRAAKSEGRRTENLVPVTIEHDDGSLEIRIDEKSRTPLEEIELRESVTILRMALSELTPVQRRCWFAAENDALTYREAASSLGIAETTFTVSLYRARQRISELVRFYPLSFISTAEILDWPGLCNRLRQEGKDEQRTVGRRVWELGSNDLHELTAEASLSSLEARGRLVHELNRILGRQDFYSRDHVGRIPPGRFTSEINSLIRKRTGPISSRQLNKLLFRNHYARFWV